jgi:hypothetical protein
MLQNKGFSARFVCIALAFQLLGCFVTNVMAQELLIIGSPELMRNGFSVRKLHRIYQRKALIGPTGIDWFPVNLPVNHPIRQSLSQRLFKQRPEDMVIYWEQKYFQGISPPYVLESQEAVIRFVSQRPGAIGYILPCKLDDRVKVIYKLQVELATDVYKAECRQ